MGFFHNAPGIGFDFGVARDFSPDAGESSPGFANSGVGIVGSAARGAGSGVGGVDFGKGSPLRGRGFGSASGLGPSDGGFSSGIIPSLGGVGSGIVSLMSGDGSGSGLGLINSIGGGII